MEKQGYDPTLIKIGELLADKRRALGKQYTSREKFIEQRSFEVFGGDQWISVRHLASIELGKNWISMEKFILHAYALETDPLALLSEIIKIYNQN